MFKKIKAFFVKVNVERKKVNAEKIYMYSHMLLVLFNNTKMMKGLDDTQKRDVYNAYVKTIYDSMTDVNKILFMQAVSDTVKAVDQIYKHVPASEVQIKRQLDEIFRSNQ